MTTLLDETTTDESADVAVHDDGMPVYKKTSTTPASATPKVAAADTSVRPAKDWFSGYCNGGALGAECRDGREENKVGEPIVRCLYRGINGEKVATPILYCACSCHDKARDAQDPNFGIKREPKDDKKGSKKSAAEKGAAESADAATATDAQPSPAEPTGADAPADEA